MSTKNTWIALLLCFALATSSNAQTALQKAQSFASQNAPFLSIKYLKKHVHKKQSDRSAMLLIAQTYFQVDLPKEGQKWLLKVNNCPTPYAYYQKVVKPQDITKDLQNKGVNMMKNHVIRLYERLETERLVRTTKLSQEQVLVVLDTVGAFL